MNVLFLSLGTFNDLSGSSVHIDVLKRFAREHSVYLVCKREQRQGLPTELSEEYGIHVLRVRTGNIKNTNLIEKGISTVMVEPQFKAAIRKFFAGVRFDLVLYTTPPVTFESVVRYIKKRDGAVTYLMLKDIFPQNAVDIGMMRTSGAMGAVYRYFRHKEKSLYAASDHIGCMSPANCEYILRHNPEIAPERVEVCPNITVIEDMSVTGAERTEIRRRYGVPEDKTVFIYGGNLGKPQGIPFLMECLRTQREKDAFFLIIGSGTEYPALKRFIAEEKPSDVALMPGLPKREYERLCAACDVGLIFLDHRFTIPNFPSRMLSYMKAKMPILAVTDPNTDVGKVITEGGFGWWCESSDAARFAALVGEIQKADLPAMGEIAYEYLKKHYDPDTAYHAVMRHFPAAAAEG